MSIAVAKSMFPNMPAEVFDVWLSPLIKKIGWPFTSVSDSVDGTGWERALGRGLPFLKIAPLRWSKVELLYSSIHLTESSRDTLDHMLACLTKAGGTGGRGAFSDSAIRTGFKLKFMQETGRVFAPLIFESSSRGLRCMDGHHRLCALSALQDDDFPVECWVGSA